MELLQRIISSFNLLDQRVESQSKRTFGSIKKLINLTLNHYLNEYDVADKKSSSKDHFGKNIYNFPEISAAKNGCELFIQLHDLYLWVPTILDGNWRFFGSVSCGD